MPGKKHLHIDEADQVGTWLSKAIGSTNSGTISVDCGDERAMTITIKDKTVSVDLVQPKFFSIPGDETSLFDKLKTASEFGRKLTESETTVSFQRKGKEAVRLGKNAKPTLSKLISRSDDIQLTGLREFTKLKNDMKTE
jgi:hypothetical protein